jgi:hypothetical protein
VRGTPAHAILYISPSSLAPRPITIRGAGSALDPLWIRFVWPGSARCEGNIPPRTWQAGSASVTSCMAYVWSSLLVSLPSGLTYCQGVAHLARLIPCTRPHRPVYP